MSVRSAGTWRQWLAPLGAAVLAALVFHALGHNPFTELYGQGDGYMTGLPSKIFASGMSSWNPWVQLGQYTYQDTQYQPFYLPGLIVMRAFPNTFGYNLFILAHYVAAGLFGYLYLRNLGLGRFAAIFGGLCFELSGFMSAHKGHTAMISAAVWLPLMLFAVDRFFETGRIRHLATGALALAMSLLGGFPQLTMYSMVLTGAYACWRAATIDAGTPLARWRSLAWTVSIIFGLGLLTAAIQVVPVAASLPDATRERLTYEMFSQEALPLYSVLCFIVPNLFGGIYGSPDYATNINFVELYPYMGLLPLALAAGAAFVCAPVFRDTRFWTATAIVGLLLAFGPATPLHPLLFGVPGYNLFRAAARHLLEVNFAIAVLAAVAVDVFMSPTYGYLRAQIVRWAAAILAASFIVSLAAAWALAFGARYVTTPDGASLRRIQLNALYTVGDVAETVSRNVAVSSRTLILPTIFLALSLGVLAWLRKSHGRSARVAIVVLVGVTVADLYTVHAAIYHYPDTRPAFHPETHEEVAVMKLRGYDATHDRVYPVEGELTYTFPVLNVLSGVTVINGYGPMWSKRYQSLSGFYNNGLQLPDRVADVKLLSVTSARFILTRSPDRRARLLAKTPPPGAPPIATRTPSPAEWGFLNAAPIEDGFSLRTSTGRNVSLARLPVTLRPDTFYAVRFEARAATGLTSPLVVDFYGPGYDGPAQDRVLYSVPPQFEEQYLMIDAGSAPPAQASLRVFTQSTAAIDIRGVRIMTMAPADASPFKELTVTEDGISVFENRHALPRFRFATDLEPAADVVDAKRIFESPSFDFAHAVTVEGLTSAQTVEPGAILSQVIGQTAMRWRLRSGTRSFFVVADSFFPGWTARVDGKPARIYAVDGFLRGVFVDGSGEHDVAMVFHPEKFWLGVAGTTAGLVLLIVMWAGGGSRRRARPS